MPESTFGPSSSFAVLACSVLVLASGNPYGPQARRFRDFAPRIPADLSALGASAPDIDPVVLERGLKAASTARRAGFGRRKPFLTIIDYARPADEYRLWVLDLKARLLVFRARVAHGRGSAAKNEPMRWSNEEGSLASSLGLFVTRDTYRGRRGYSLRLIGLEPGFNDLAFRRSIVMHGAGYMSEGFRARRSTFGESHGCPAVDPRVARPLIDLIRGGSLLFIHYPDPTWLAGSAWLHGRVPPNLKARGRGVAKKARRRPSEPSARPRKAEGGRTRPTNI